MSYINILITFILLWITPQINSNSNCYAIISNNLECIITDSNLATIHKFSFNFESDENPYLLGFGYNDNLGFYALIRTNRTFPTQGQPMIEYYSQNKLTVVTSEGVIDVDIPSGNRGLFSLVGEFGLHTLKNDVLIYDMAKVYRFDGHDKELKVIKDGVKEYFICDVAISNGDILIHYIHNEGKYEDKYIYIRDKYTEEIELSIGGDRASELAIKNEYVAYTVYLDNGLYKLKKMNMNNGRIENVATIKAGLDFLVVPGSILVNTKSTSISLAAESNYLITNIYGSDMGRVFTLGGQVLKDIGTGNYLVRNINEDSKIEIYIVNIYEINLRKKITINGDGLIYEMNAAGFNN